MPLQFSTRLHVCKSAVFTYETYITNDDWLSNAKTVNEGLDGV